MLTRLHLHLAHHRLILTAILALLVTACSTLPRQTTGLMPEDTLLARAHKAEERGDFESAASHYLQLASQASALKKDEYRLQASRALLKGNYINRAEQILVLIDDNALHEQQRIRKQVMLARIDIARNNYRQALDDLSFSLGRRTPDDLRAEVYAVLATAYEHNNQLLDAARYHFMRADLLSDENERVSAQQAGWQLLSLVPDAILAATTAGNDEFGGWLALSRLARQVRTAQLDMKSALDNWRQQYPQHPVAEEIIASLLARQQDTTRFPAKIALLLNFQDNYEKAASSLRDGFLAARYQQQGNTVRPEILIYDISAYDSVKDAYAQAVRDGAGFVVGPLGKNYVTELGRMTSRAIPVLSLNYSESPVTGDENFFQFGLSPEDEARQVAERAWLDGHNKAIAIIPDSDWGKRVYDAFSENWQALGGTVLESQSYPPEATDFSRQLTALLNIDESDQRYRQLARLLGTRVKFEPRRRQDTDFVFMAAFPKQARLLRPQFKFHYAGDLPLYATSHVYSGKPSRNKDRDMDDIIFCDIPWVLVPDKATTLLKHQLERLWPDMSDQYTRFYALGFDAYNLVPHLQYMRDFAYERYSGVTGILQLDGKRRIFRQLPWARFRNGLPRPLS